MAVESSSMSGDPNLRAEILAMIAQNPDDEDIKQILRELDGQDSASAPEHTRQDQDDSPLGNTPASVDHQAHGIKRSAEHFEQPETMSSTPLRDWKVNDRVLAKWWQDKRLYSARIVSKTGSSSNPQYTVVFDGFSEHETVSAHDIMPKGSSGMKRQRNDDAPPPPPTSNAVTSPPPPPVAGTTISAASTVNPSLVGASTQREPSKATDGPERPAKVPRKSKATQKLNEQRKSWQDFSTKGKFSKAVKRDSQFRTIGASAAKTATPATRAGVASKPEAPRSRHEYNMDGANDED